MKKIFIFLAFLTCFNFILICEENKNLEQANTYYDSDNYTNALDYYVKAVQAGESNSGTTYYRLAYSWENVNPNASKYFSKFYSIAAYCFERDNDNENKYYSYSIKKEEKYNISHNSLNEKKIQKIINNDLSQKKIDYKKSESPKKKDSEKSDIFPIVIALIIGLFCAKKFGFKSGAKSTNTNNQTESQYTQQTSSKTINPPANQNIKYYCKYCGEYAFKISSLNNGQCTRNQNGRFHVLYQGDKPYECVLCGEKSNHLNSLVRGKCFFTPNHTGYHRPYEGHVRNPYICKYCGQKTDTLKKLVTGVCIQNRNGKFHAPIDNL